MHDWQLVALHLYKVVCGDMWWWEKWTKLF